jgi:hypothetical protein
MIGLLFRLVGWGLGLGALVMTAVALILQPVIIVEPNWIIRVFELIGIGVATVSLVSSLKRFVE